MVARSQADCQAAPWKRELAGAITRPEELLDLLDLDPELLSAAHAAAVTFRLLVPRGYAALMTRGDPQDPLLRQVLPLGDELQDPPGFSTDPVGDHAALRTPGLLQKYQGRALLLVSGACAMHCRYCFRRHFPFGELSLGAHHVAEAITRLGRDSSINEVILSGGDPLMLDDHALADLVARLEEISHLRRLRLHTRIPIILPSRTTDRLCRTLRESRLRPVLVVHTNHARELGAETRTALEWLRLTGAVLLNQSVLLRGVNDDAQRLAELSEALFECDVLPYYLHLLDKVSGAAHFDVDEATAARLLDRLRRLLPGYLVPRLVREVAGEPYKTPVDATNP
jgi:L-lysine 2,3-aminomutase